jgi:hypothetical protein
MATEPVVWIESDLWFNYLVRRLLNLYELHGTISKLGVPNYGIISGLFAFLMQSMFFTPSRVEGYVRESLALLRYRENSNMFGMFFLDSLDVSKKCVIEEIVEYDDAGILRLLKLTQGSRRQSQARHAELEMVDDDQDQFPLGRNPTWQQISISLKANPTILIPKWDGTLDRNLQKYDKDSRDSNELALNAGKVFISFTRQIWLKLGDYWKADHLKRDTVQTVEDALEVWSVDRCLDKTTSAVFLGINTTGDGRHREDFKDRRKIFFPDGREWKLDKAWKEFGFKHGYISLYRELEVAGSKEEVDVCLEELLDYCQCLPDSSNGRVWHTEAGRVVFVTNPRYYKIVGIGRARDRNQGAVRNPRAQ